MKSKIFEEGCMCEGYPWEIRFNEECSENGGGHPCKHCRSKKTIEHVRYDGDIYLEKVWICPRVVVAFNEGECNCTMVCLDCILDAVESLEEYL